MDKTNNFITCQLKGGLGNYLFQIISTLGISKKQNKKFIIDLKNIHVGHNHILKYKENIFSKLDFETIDLDVPIYVVHEVIKYCEIPNFDHPIKLDGYLQNEKYFKDYKNIILNLLSPNLQILDKLNNKYSEILKKQTCSIHVRRGDYVNLQHIHNLQNLEFYQNCYNLIKNECDMFLIFSDDIDWCKSNFDFIENKIFIENNEDYEDLYLMSLCRHNIISNSTFSWWGAWINQNINKKVFYPSKWFNVDYIDYSEIGCDKWIKI
jgi:hypothetical protein